MSIDRQVDEPNVVHPSAGVFIQPGKAARTDLCHDMGAAENVTVHERGQTQKTTRPTTPFPRGCKTGAREAGSRLRPPRAGCGGDRVTARGQQVSTWAVNVLELHRSVGHRTLQIPQNLPSRPLQMGESGSVNYALTTPFKMGSKEEAGHVALPTPPPAKSYSQCHLPGCTFTQRLLSARPMPPNAQRPIETSRAILPALLGSPARTTTWAQVVLGGLPPGPTTGWCQGA